MVTQSPGVKAQMPEVKGAQQSSASSGPVVHQCSPRSSQVVPEDVSRMIRIHSPEYGRLGQTCAEIRTLVVQMTKAVSQNQCDSVPLVAKLQAGREMQRSLIDSLQAGFQTLLNADYANEEDEMAWCEEV